MSLVLALRYPYSSLVASCGYADDHRRRLGLVKYSSKLTRMLFQLVNVSVEHSVHIAEVIQQDKKSFLGNHHDGCWTKSSPLGQRPNNNGFHFPSSRYHDVTSVVRKSMSLCFIRGKGVGYCLVPAMSVVLLPLNCESYACTHADGASSVLFTLCTIHQP
jgi:hypothetical protein